MKIPKKLAGVFRIDDIKKKLLVYLLLIVLIMITMSIQYIYETGNRRTFDQISVIVAGQFAERENKPVDMSGIEDYLNNRRRRTVAVSIAGFLLVMGVAAAFIRNVVLPLNEIARATKKITDGDLTVTVPVKTEDEIGEIGNRINDLSANLQEILLDVWNGSTHSMRLIDEIDNSIRCRECNCINCISPELRKELEFVRRHTEDMQAIVQAFDLYDVHLEDGKVKSGPQPDVEWD